VVASPASFNNRAGLSRAVNEQLAEGTEVFVAEMGTYGKGEIAELCGWLRPDIAAITAIGPVHLERFRTEDAIVGAKSEILDGAATVVLPVDDERLAALADLVGVSPAAPDLVGGSPAVPIDGDRSTKPVRKVVRCSTSSGPPGEADVEVVEVSGLASVKVGGEVIAEGTALTMPARNVAVAVAIALELGVDPEEIAERLDSLPEVPHRLQRLVGSGGATVLDDTYNSNPAGAAIALAALERESSREQVLGEDGELGGGRRCVLVTPGMVELGKRQVEENAKLAEEAARTATDVVVVGRTNRKALLTGLKSAARVGREGGSPKVVLVDSRERAVEWVRSNLGAGDVVLYENDLPDQYP
jgi:UDP-N-acetylmuramoyl-tripeptide--D-alanyl-D-alanine ligase